MRSRNSQPKLGKLLFTLFVPEEIGLALGDGDVGVHAAAIDAGDGLGQEASGIAHVGGDLAAEQLVELDLVGRGDDLAVAEVDFKLAGRYFGVVLLVLEAHGALHFGGGVDELAQRIERKRVVVSAGRDEFEFAGFVVGLLGILAGEEEALDLGGRIQGVLLFCVELVSVGLQHTAQIAGVGRAVLVDDDAEDKHLAIAKNVCGHPVEGAPIDAETQIALFLRGKAANR